MSSTKNQPWNDPRVTAYVLDELSPEERTSFEKEMATDDSLAQAVAGAGDVTGQLSALFETETTPPLTDGRRAAIINEPVIVRPEDDKNGRVGLIALLTIAAGMFIAIGLWPAWDAQRVAKNESSIPTAAKDKMSLDAAPDVQYEEVKSLVDEVSAIDPSAAAKRPPASELQWAESSGSSNVPKQDSSEPTVKEIFDDASTKIAEAIQGKPRSQSGPRFSDLQQGDMTLADIAPSPELDRNVLAKNRSRMLRSQLLETAPQSEAAPDMQARPRPSAEFSDMDMGGMDMMDMGMGIEESILPASGGRPEPLNSKRQSQLTKDGYRKAYAAEMRRGGAVLGITPRIIIDEEEELAQTGFGRANSEGRGPGHGGDRFDRIVENDFIRTADHPLSTFSADVDTASYSKVRDYLMRANQLPRPDAVRIEEMINYFEYSDAPPADDADHPFAARVNITECPWNAGHRLARIAIKGKTMKPKERPACNLVFLLDTSGSMNAANKLPLVIEGMKMLTGQLTKKDKVAIVVYAGSAGLVLDSTPAKKKKKIRRALENLSAGGSTNGGQGISLAYQTAREQFIEGGVNRVILCTDGDFNVGTTGTDSLVRMVEKEAKDDVYLTVLGFGMGNHNDAMLEQISGRGNGNYAFIDNQREAHKVLVKQTAGTLVTIAKDVKLQVDFNSAKVGAYRLIGYENRILAKEDFNDDTKDAGEIGAGHSVTALYELVPPELADKVVKPAVDESKYVAKEKDTDKESASSDEESERDWGSDEALNVRVRYKQPDADSSTRVDFPAIDAGQSFADSSVDTRFTAAVAGFGMLLRGSQHSGDWELSDALKVAKSSLGDDESELRSEFVELVKKAKQLRGE